MLRYILINLLLFFTKSIKNCIHCKHYLNIVNDQKYIRIGKCNLFPLKEPIIDYTFLDPSFKDIQDKCVEQLLLKYAYCSTARFFPDMCGYFGKKFELSNNE